MAEFSSPAQTIDVEVDGYHVVAYSWGEGDDVVFLLSGGPGLPCRYLVEPHLQLVDAGYRVISYDQLGTGASDQPKDDSLWNIQRFACEVETVRNALNLEGFHLLGHSWGGWLGIEYAVTFPGVLRSLVIADSAGDIPHLSSELNRLRSALGPETVHMMQRREAEGSIDHPEYKAAITLLSYRHVCRLEQWPQALVQSGSEKNNDPYRTVQGPNEFLYIGNLKDWNRIEDMKSIDQPCLIVVGAYDELTPACALRMQNALPDAETAVFGQSSHMPFYEEPGAYIEKLQEFLGCHSMVG